MDYQVFCADNKPSRTLTTGDKDQAHAHAVALSLEFGKPVAVEIWHKDVRQVRYLVSTSVE